MFSSITRLLFGQYNLLDLLIFYLANPSYLIAFSLEFQWLYYKMCALPLPEVLGDFEDAIRKTIIYKPIHIIFELLLLNWYESGR